MKLHHVDYVIKPSLFHIHETEVVRSFWRSVGIDGAEDYNEKSATLEAMCRSEAIKYLLCQGGGGGGGGGDGGVRDSV